jgi:hypothetical protein
MASYDYESESDFGSVSYDDDEMSLEERANERIKVLSRGAAHAKLREALKEIHDGGHRLPRKWKFWYVVKTVRSTEYGNTTITFTPFLTKTEAEAHCGENWSTNGPDDVKVTYEIIQNLTHHGGIECVVDRW